MKRSPAARARGSARRIVLVVIVLLAALAAAGVPGVTYFRGRIDAQRLTASLEEADDLAASFRIREFFLAKPKGLLSGDFDLAVEDPLLREKNLRLWRRLLEDDDLLESGLHLRPRPEKGKKHRFSALQWLASEESSGWRARLLQLCGSASPAVRSDAVRSLGLIGLKIPEALSAEPLPPFRREHARALLVSQSGERPAAPLALRPFLRELLLRPAALRLWASGEPLRTDETLGIALRAILVLEDVIGGELADALVACPDPGPHRSLLARALGRTSHPRAWRRLAELLAGPASGGPGSGSAGSLTDRLAALRALRDVAPVQALRESDGFPGLLKLSGEGDDPRFQTEIRETIECLAGGPIGEGSRVDPQPFRLGALQALPAGEAGAARLGAALRFHAVEPAAARRDAGLRRLLEAQLGAADPRVRREAVRACSRVALGETRAAESGRPSLIGLLGDPSLSVAQEAASSLFALTAWWPDGGADSSGPSPPGTLPLAAADPDRFRSWIQLWEAWQGEHRARPPAELYLEALESGSVERAAAAARGLEVLARERTIGSAWYRRNEKRILPRLLSLPPSARSDLLGAVSLCAEARDSVELWRIYDPAFRRDPVDAVEILRAVRRLVSLPIDPGARSGGGAAPAKSPERPSPAQIIDAFLAAAASRPGDSSALIIQFLDRHYPAEEIDGRLLAALDQRPPDARGPAGDRPAVKGKGEAAGRPGEASARANLARWFPRAAGREDARALVRFLEDPDGMVRFWALLHLKDLGADVRAIDPQAAAGPLPPSVKEGLDAWADAYTPRS